MISALSTFFTRYWIAVAVITFAFLSLYTSDATFGQAATPTPDVNTVPRPDAILTPTNTPFPSPTPADDDRPSGGGGVPQPNPTATRTPNNGNNNSGGNNSNPGGNATGNTSPEPAAPQTSDTAVNGTVNTVTLNVRREPNTGANIVDTIFMGETVQVLGRDSGGSWLYICCGTGAGRPGWVSAQFVSLADAEAMATIPVTANSSAAAVDGSASITGTNALTVPLVLEMRPSPAFVWQGQVVEIQFVVHNRSDQPLTNVRLRNDLPATLRYMTTSTSAQGEVNTTGTVADGLLFAINWPEIAAGSRLTATVTVQVASSLGNGALIDNLAVVDTAEGAEALAGLTFAMPPMRPPRFR